MCVLRESEVLRFVSPVSIALDTTRSECTTTPQNVHPTGKHLLFRWCREYYRRPPLVARTRSRYTERWKNTTSIIARSGLTFVSSLHFQEKSRKGCSRLFFQNRIPQNEMFQAEPRNSSANQNHTRTVDKGHYHMGDGGAGVLQQGN